MIAFEHEQFLKEKNIRDLYPYPVSYIYSCLIIWVFFYNVVIGVQQEICLSLKMMSLL